MSDNADKVVSYYRARYYDSHIGRFINEDPNKDGVGGSMYMYVENSPLRKIDPLGTKGLQHDPNYKPEWGEKFDEGFAEAMARLQDSDCHKFFLCDKKNKTHLDPEEALLDTTYRIMGLSNNTAGAVTRAKDLVWINEDGPFVTDENTQHIPSDKKDIITFTEVKFPSGATKNAFILLHELGHQLGIFPRDTYPWINGTHSLAILDNCFRDVKHE